MSVSIVRGTNKKPASSQKLVDFFEYHSNLQGELFIGYPIISSPEGRYPIDALWLSPAKGIVLFDLIEGMDPRGYKNRQDDFANKLESRLKAHRELMRRRHLVIPIHTITFAPGVYQLDDRENEYLLANSNSLPNKIGEIEEWTEKDEDVYRTALSAIQSISTIRKGRTIRKSTREDSRGAKLKQLEDSIATLDLQQSRAVIETVDGVQRIRGLAGSGKTIVLALKAAYLHTQHPDWRIAVTFHTRSLKGQFRNLINNFSLQQTGEEPDWNNLRILNAWGASGRDGRNGIYYEFCRSHDIEYYDFRSARKLFGRDREFYGACKHALSQASQSKAMYDVILVDEAQDFPPEFLRLCYQSLDDSKRLVYAYDELQNLAGESLPAPEDIFGRNATGSPNVSLDVETKEGRRRDVILDVCYRNSRPLLVTAHALGFGIYREADRAGTTGLVQMFDYPQLWEDIGYRVKNGALSGGSRVTLERSDDTSPAFLEEHSQIDDLIQFIPFEDEQEQDNWLVNEIKKNLKEDELRSDDIIVINPDPISTREKVGPIRSQLLDIGIECHLAGVDLDPDIFFRTGVGSVTFSGVFRAKGNEAGMVYIINAQDCQSSHWNLASIRNRLFTAITRSKAWVRVLGVGGKMVMLKNEYEKLRSLNFELRFKYPTDEERQHLRVIHRDLTEKDRKKQKSIDRTLVDLVKDLESGKMHMEDLNEDTRAKLLELLSEHE